jgi:hypothetical protein
MSQTLLQVLKEIEKQIPLYYTRPLENGFVGIYNSKNNKLTSVVSEKYILVQSRDLFKEVLLSSFNDVHILRYALKTNLKKHYLYLRLQKEPYQQKFMVILINSIDRSNAVKMLAGVYEWECGNDLAVLYGFYIKHTKDFKLKINLNEIINYVITNYYNLEKMVNPIPFMDKETIAKLKKIVYLNEERIEQLRQLKNSLEVYRTITNWMSKKYNIAYFEKINYLFKLLV